MAKAKKTKAKTKEPKLAVKGSFLDIINAVVKDANDKSPKPLKSDKKD